MNILSASRFALGMTCRGSIDMIKKATELGLAQQPSEAMSRGIAIHKALATLDMSQLTDADREVATKCLATLDSLQQLHPPAFAVLKEVRQKYPDGGSEALFAFTADAKWVSTLGETIIVDYKTGTRENQVGWLKYAYKWQMLTTAAASAMLNKTQYAYAYIIWADEGATAEQVVSLDAYGILFICDLIEFVSRSKPRLSVGDWCFYCGANAVCPAMKNSVELMLDEISTLDPLDRYRWADRALKMASAIQKGLRPAVLSASADELDKHGIRIQKAEALEVDAAPPELIEAIVNRFGHAASDAVSVSFAKLANLFKAVSDGPAELAASKFVEEHGGSVSPKETVKVVVTNDVEIRDPGEAKAGRQQKSIPNPDQKRGAENGHS